MTLPTSRPFSAILIDLMLENRHSRTTPELHHRRIELTLLRLSSVFRSNDRQSLSTAPATLAAVSLISFRVFYNTPATPAALSINWLDLASIIRYTMYLCNDSNFDFKALPDLPFYRIWEFESSKDLTRWEYRSEYEEIRRFQRSGHWRSFETFQATKLRNFEIQELDSSQI